MSSHRTLSLRTSIFLGVLLGVLLPVAVAGVWLTRTTETSGELFVRARLEQSLGEVVEAVGVNWIGLRADLLALAESSSVVRGSPSGEPLGTQSSAESSLEALDGGTRLDAAVMRVVFRDRTGSVSRQLEREAESTASDGAEGPSATVTIRLPLYERLSGELVGSMEAVVRLARLLAGGLSTARSVGSVLAVFDEGGDVVLLPGPMDPELFLRERFEWGSEEWLVVRHQFADPPLQVAVAGPMSPFTTPFTRAARRGAVALLLVLVTSVLLTVLLSRRLTGPLERLSTAAEAVSQGDLSRRVEAAGPDEIRRLAHAFNGMTESLERTLRQLAQRESVAAVGEFAATLAHEVRNPLTSIRLDLQRARARIEPDGDARMLLDQALEAVMRLDATVSGSLRVARSGSLTLQPLDLRMPLEAALHAAEPEVRAHGAVLSPPALTRPLTVRGNRAALEQLFLNLLLNAAQASSESGRVHVQIEEAAGHLRVHVRDEGAGISPEEIGRVLEPFYSTREGGTGLGLPIASRIAKAHGGDLEIESSVGKGTTATLVIARTDEPHQEA